ncbi:MAG: C25 family cysteine peptidase, partial [Ignavibacteria bacterium]|nr:C25 family cysteine peptidase [Ignavibacteria bacterium]
HRHGVSINSTSPQDTITYNYGQTVNFSTKFNSNILNNGTNTLRIFGMPTSASFHQSLVDWIDIDFYRKNVAKNDSLLMFIPDSVTKRIRAIKIENISSADSLIVLYKIKPYLKKIENFTLLGTTTKILLFTDTVKGGDVYYLTTVSKTQNPIFVYKKNFINLRSSSRSAEYVIITNKIFESSANDYKNFIQTKYNKTTELIFVNDIFDEFAYGGISAESIRDFLKSAYQNWAPPKLSYLLLIGDANYDFRHVVEPAPSPRKQNYVISYGQPVSDVWYTCWDSSDVNIQQMFIGRIPINSNNELNIYKQKHEKFLLRPFDEWNKSYLLFSGGNPSKPSELAQIKQANDLVQELAKNPPIGGMTNHFYKTISPPSNFGPFTLEEVQAAINRGGLFISYIGHSGTRTWDNGITEVEHLKNSFPNRLPLITDFGCSTGRFAEPDVDAFGELFISQSNDGQAIAYLGNSSWGYLSTSIKYPQLFYSILLSDTLKSISQVHFIAKMRLFQESGFTDVNRVFNYCNLFFGDPIVSFALPKKANLTIDNSGFILKAKLPNDRTDSVQIQVSYRNLGKVFSDTFKILIEHKWKDSLVYSAFISRLLPKNSDTLNIYLPIYKRSGQHILTVKLDANNQINEIYENDNQAQFDFYVYPSRILPIHYDKNYSIIDSNLNLL